MIERKLLVPPKLMFPFLEVPALAAVIILLSYALWKGPGAVLMFVPAVILAMVIAAPIRSLVLYISMKSEAEERIRAAIGRAPLRMEATASKLPDSPRIGASGIAWDGDRLYIMEAGELATIPWSDVRSWTWRIPGYSKSVAYGGGLNTAAQVWNENASAQVEAAANSGFFVQVADLDRPTWHFQCSDRRVLERWYEILNQIKEGGLRSASAA